MAEFISDEMEINDVPFKSANKMSIAIDEMVSNVVNNANATIVEISFEKKKIPILTKVQKKKIGGLGIFMAKKLMTSLTYVYENHLNCLTMELKNKGRM